MSQILSCLFCKDSLLWLVSLSAFDITCHFSEIPFVCQHLVELISYDAWSEFFCITLIRIQLLTKPVFLNSFRAFWLVWHLWSKERSSEWDSRLSRLRLCRVLFFLSRLSSSALSRDFFLFGGFSIKIIDLISWFALKHLFFYRFSAVLIFIFCKSNCLLFVCYIPLIALLVGYLSFFLKLMLFFCNTLLLSTLLWLF